MGDVQQLRSIAERLCAVRTGTDDEIKTALGLPVSPAPLNARECVITAGELSLASVAFKYSEPAFTRQELDALFGQATALPRTGPGAVHVLHYELRVAGAPACIGVFARFFEAPQPTTGARSILLRIDPA